MIVRPQDFLYFLRDIGSAAGLDAASLDRVDAIVFDDPGRGPRRMSDGTVSPLVKPLRYTLQRHGSHDGPHARIGRDRVSVTLLDGSSRVVWASGAPAVPETAPEAQPGAET